MRTPARTATVAAAFLAAVVALSACSLLGPARDSDGRVTTTTEIDSTTLLVGDCFSFVDGTNLGRANVTPCTKQHTYVVIGSGTLSDAQVQKDNGVQNAVSVACSSDFEKFKAAAAAGTRPEQQFVVSTGEKDGKQVTLYLCVATDSVATAAG
jgi:hypothetical protein